MPATLLVTDPAYSWREWIKSNLADRDLVCLDVANADYGPPGRVFLVREGKTRAYRFVGSVYANRNPVELLIGAQQLDQARDPVVALFEMRESPRMSSSLTRRRVPSPPHFVHAPNGELNENCRGSSSGSEMPHAGQP